MAEMTVSCRRRNLVHVPLNKAASMPLQACPEHSIEYAHAGASETATARR